MIIKTQPRVNTDDLYDHYSVFNQLAKELEFKVANVLGHCIPNNIEECAEKLRLIRYSVSEMLGSIHEGQIIYSNKPGESTKEKYEKFKREWEE